MKKYLLIIIFFLVIIAISCTEQNAASKRIKVVATILPLAEFASEVGGDNIAVTVMIPPGASVHSYEPTPGQLTELNKARLYIKVGTPVEFERAWLDKILSISKNIFVCDASTNIELIKTGDHKNSPDPHIWLSPKNAKIILENIGKGFIAIDPRNKDYYKKNKEAYIARLDSLDKYIESVLSEKINRRFIVYHPAWGYFARDYNLQQIPVEIEGKEPTAKGIQHLIEIARKYDVKIIFASPQFNTESAEVIAQEIQGEVVLIDPLARNYVSNMKRVARALKKAME
jgi:zinc transport system substrate-binding protein